jgi:16S rRNA (cytidine1402-2'-O)-methyltransferase
VTVLPGPSAVETALVASGLVGERVTFLGYLPRRAAERERLWQELAGWTWPAVAFESPRRLPGSLASLAATDPDRPVAVCRELTKRFEEVVRGSAAEVAARFAEPPKGEITVVFGAASPRRADDADALAAVADLVAAGLPRGKAAELVARLTGVPRNSLYRGSLDEPTRRT